MSSVRARAILSLAAMALMLAPVSARAQHCASSVFIHSYVADALSPPVSSLCLLDDGHSAPVDYRVINPGATSLLVQYLADVGQPELHGSLTGLGFTASQITLRRTLEPATGSYYYASDILEIPAGPTASGCLIAEIRIAPEDIEAFDDNAYHTVDTSCPDYP